jgi:hypothetical protein
MATRMQQRKGTAAQWISTNSGDGPVLNAGEIGFELDTNKFKIGDGVNHWVDLVYFTDSASALAAINSLIDSAPAALNTLNELAAAINDDPAFFTTIATNLSNHQSDTTNIHGIADTSVLETQQGAQSRAESVVSGHNSDTTDVHGIADTALLATKSYADSAVSTHSSDTTNVHGIADTAELATKSYADTAVSTHNLDTTDVHGIADFADLATQQYVLDQIDSSTDAYPDLAGEGIAWNAVSLAFDIDSTVATKSYADDAVSTHNSDTTSVHGIADTSVLETTSGAQSKADTAVSTHNSDTTNVHGIADTAQLATKSYADDAVSTHNSDTTSVHGIADTSLLATKSYADDAVSTHSSDTTNVHGIADTALLATKAYADDAVSTHNTDTTNVHGIENTANLATKQYAAGLLLNATKTNITITGDVDGLTINAENGVADATTDNLTEGANNLYFSNERAQDAVGNSVGTGLSYNDATGAVSVDTTAIQVRVADVSDTEIGYLNGVTSSIQTQIDTKASLVSPTFTGTVSLPANTISQSMMGDDSVGTNEIGGLAVTTEKIAALAVTEGKIADGAVTSVKIANGAVTKSMVGLSNVDNTSDANKPVSTATQTALDAKLALAGGTMTGALTLSADPSSSLHAATKQYVDNTASGVVAKPQVLAATSTNLVVTYANGTAGVGATLTATSNGAWPETVAGATGWSIGKGLLVKNQTNKAHNGRYYLSDLGSASTPWVLTRCGYCDEADEIPGAYIFVQAGTLAGTGWIQTVADPATFVVGTDNIDVFQFSGSGTITAGTGITVSGNEVSISTGAITSSLILDGTIVDGDINASAAIAQSKISGLTSDLAAKAPLADPTFTGTATIPTLTLTNPLSAANGGTGVSSLGTGVATFLGTPSSANLAAMITDEIGTGNIVLSEISTSSQTASYTLVAGDRGKLVEMNVGSANNLTVPLDSSVNFPTGTQIDILQVGSGQTTVVATVGVTINGTPGLKIRAQWGGATLIKRAANTWVLIGDLTA